MKLVNGVDLIEIHRIQEAIDRYGQSFLNRIYTPEEIALFGNNPASLAVRFAAKEAVAKALGTGIGKVCWKDIEVLRNSVQQPTLHLHGAAQELATAQGLSQWSISLSHTKMHAIAMVVAIGA